MKYKALFLDLDGTVVSYSDPQNPSARVIEAIKKAKDKVIVSIATGRPLYIVIDLIQKLDINGLSVICNGLQIYDPVAKSVVSEYKIDRDKISQIQKISWDLELPLSAYDGIYDYPYPDVDNPDRKALSVYFPVVSPLVISDLDKKLSEVEGIAVHKMPAWQEGFFCVDVTGSEVSKLHGINEVYTRLEINRDEVIGVGDSYNDYPLLLACGFKVAMGNAVREVKEIADYIAPSVDDDGVADVIEKFIL
jgi:HAD superfamily hydrolase (TIGR01484 family)